jgi:hypothetical protein
MPNAPTLKRAAQLALECQDACNLSGVLATFKEIVHETLWPEARRLGKGTDWINQHPICALFLDKLTDLNRRQDFSTAYDAVSEIAGAREENPTSDTEESHA